MTNKDSAIKDIDIEKIIEKLQEYASQSKNEEDLKIRTEKLLKSEVKDKWDIDWGSYEDRDKITGERKDALHGTVIIEYKSPGTLEKSSKFDKAKKQLKRYLKSETEDEKKLQTYFGILFDGEKISFIRHRRDEWEEQREPSEVNSRTISRLLGAIRGLRRKPIKPDLLLKDFGPGSKQSIETIHTLYKILNNNVSGRTEALFEDWKRVFSQVCAYSPDKIEGLVDKYNVEEEDVDVEKLLFSVHTYYTLVMKLLTSEIVTLYADSFLGSYLKKLEESYMNDSEKMLDDLDELEEGGIFQEVGIKNFLEADYFAWYLDEWNEDLSETFYKIIKKLLNYEPATVELKPETTKDLFKRLYQNLLPKKIRHDLGEYFTPDWLAEYMIEETGFEGDPDKRILDPCCGSGTFLILSINKIRQYARDNFIDERKILSKILENVNGIDLNPLAILAAKANYIIALSDLLRYRSDDIEIPIYLADSILTKKRISLTGKPEFEMETSVGKFWVREELIERGLWNPLLEMIDNYISMEADVDVFKKALRKKVTSEDTRQAAIRLYKKFLDLHNQEKDRIWTKVIKNSFAPHLIGKFDYVIGNPPWVLWDNLPERYRNKMKKLWKEYKLFTLGGTEARHGGGKKDISLFFTYRCMDRYLKDGGKLGFLITQSLFKSKKAGEGFRRSKIKDEPVGILKAYDFVEINPFEGANNKTGAVVMSKEGETEYPIQYFLWKKNKNISLEDGLETAKEKSKILNFEAVPSDEENELSPWLTLPEKAAKAVKKARGQCEYQAFEGINSGGLNSAFWLKILDKIPDGEKQVNIPNYLREILKVDEYNNLEIKEVLVENITKGMKKKVKKVKKNIETFFIYPLIKSKHLKRWHIKGYNYALQMQNPKDKVGYEENWVKTNFPGTYSFLKKFKEKLNERSAYRKYFDPENDPFYTMYNIREETFSSYKVAWNQMGRNLRASVINSVEDEYLGEKLILPEHVLAFFPAKNKKEAHYLSGIINSNIVDLVIRSIAGGTKSLGTPKIIEDTINIPKFSEKNEKHQRIAELSKKAHKLAEEGQKDKLEGLEEKVDKAVGELYGITEEEVEEVEKTIELLES